MKKLLIQEINRYVGQYPEKTRTMTEWGTPLTGFAASRDPLFEQLKSVVSPAHALPSDFLENARTVVAVFFPFKKELMRTNIKHRYASREWGTAYIETNEMIRNLSLYLQDFLAERGESLAVIPATHNWDEQKLISNWSHRHVAYIAGVGNFGLNNMLITKKGCCGRLGSFVTTIEVDADPRSELPACLFKYDGSCRKCVERCVNDALLENGFNRFKCYELLLENVERLQDLGYADVCGKCLAAVPCSHANPVAKKMSASAKRTG